MKFSPVPKYVFRKITDISPAFLELHGVRFFMLDMDNTIAAYGKSIPSANILKWAEKIKLSGIELFIVTNSRRMRRVASFAHSLGVGYVRSASKPSPKGIFSALKQAEYSADESALAGDQVYTDVIAANLAGVLSIAVRPLSRHNPFHAIRYLLETPFRAVCKNKMIGSSYG